MRLLHRHKAITALGALTILLAASGCSRGGSGSGGESIQFFLNMGNDTPQYKVMSKLVDAYEKQAGVTIKVTAESVNYEDQMKVRLASRNVPDLFSTHGWSLLRYSKFLMPLNSQPWAKDVNPSLNSAMRDSKGQIFAFPGETDVVGLSYNKDVLAKAGIDPSKITTWSAFDAAAKAVAEKGITPIVSSGKDQGPAGHIADYLAIDSYNSSELAKMKSGTFVSGPYTRLLERVKSWEKKGWFNKDYSSASQDDMARALAGGTAGFALMQNQVLTAARQYNPKAKLGFVPIPPTVGDKPYLVGGEGVDSFGVSKTSGHKKEVLGFLKFLAKPENAAALAEATGSAAGLTNVKTNFGSLAPSFHTYVTNRSVTLKPYFDRVYLPNGSWNTMVATTDSVISGQGTVGAAVNQMKRQYYALYGQK
ncbi:ABC transporter substrate-binding protein [Streptomyces sp. NPDC059850]|uniref:ABC transporter substrate-binding protein n=1 Tax=Streptomyces sp. NPDC059850 TaxID=3346970 RepID=UPI003650D900